MIHSPLVASSFRALRDKQIACVRRAREYMKQAAAVIFSALDF